MHSYEKSIYIWKLHVFFCSYLLVTVATTTLPSIYVVYDSEHLFKKINMPEPCIGLLWCLEKCLF